MHISILLGSFDVGLLPIEPIAPPVLVGVELALTEEALLAVGVLVFGVDTVDVVLIVLLVIELVPTDAAELADEVVSDAVEVSLLETTGSEAVPSDDVSEEEAVEEHDESNIAVATRISANFFFMNMDSPFRITGIIGIPIN